MPEGDTVFQVATLLRPRLVGERILDAWIRTGEREWLCGRTVTAIVARGKHLLIELDDGVCVRSHLGLYGSWHRYAPGERWRKPQHHAALALWTATKVVVCFHAREVELLAGTGVRQRILRARLGPDLLTDALAGEALVARARALLPGATPLVDVLLDQRVACGVGNVYKSEVLFLRRLAPLRRLDAVADGDLATLFACAAELLRRNRDGGPRTTRFVADGRGRLWVYGRRERPCFECGAPVRYARLGAGQRGSYWCEHCQGESPHGIWRPPSAPA
ncbi:MAG: DNA-formamidopyrimidine glycosylase family protein [Thiotrichales bacterium]